MSLVDLPTLYNPFIGDPVQSNRLKAFCQVIVGGVDVTDKLEPHLEEVRVIDGPLKQAFLQIDDRDGRLPIPPARTPVQISLGWANESLIKVMDGFTFDFEHSANRGEGRKIWIHVFSASLMDKIKQPIQDHWGEGTPPGAEVGNMVGLQSVISKAAQNAGLGVRIHPRLGNIKRDYWSQNGESYMQFAQKIADEHGAIFGIDGPNQSVLTYPGQEPDGSPSGVSCVAEWGRNLISSRVRPWSSRGSWSGAHQQYYDDQMGQWKSIANQFNLGAPFNAAQAIFGLPSPAPNKQVAEQQNDGARERAFIEGGEGRIIINGEPSAKWRSFVELRGVRPGVNGFYFIWTAEHQYNRQSGYVTWLEVNTWLSGSGDGPRNHFGDVLPAPAPVPPLPTAEDVR